MRQAVIDVGGGEGSSPDEAALMSTLVSAGLSAFDVLACDGDRVVLQVTLADPLDEDRMSALDAVEDVECLGRSDARVDYVVQYRLDDLPCHSDRPATAAGEPAVLSVDYEGLSEDGVTFELTGSGALIRETVDGLEAAGADVSLRALGTYDGPDRPLDGLTDRQRDVLETSHRLGYFEVPRRADLEDVAAELGLDRSTVSEHLQRAERNLLESILSR